MSQAVHKSRFSAIVKTHKTYNPNADEQRIKKAFDLAMAARGEKKAQMGARFLSHPLDVAETTLKFRIDEDGLIGALLHDTIELDLIAKDTIATHFGESVSSIVQALGKLSKYRLKNTGRKGAQVKSFRKMFLAMASDLRVILIMLADRLATVRSYHEERIAFKKKAKQEARENKNAEAKEHPDCDSDFAMETLEIYAPIAGRLGIQWIKIELENYAFACLYPKEYDRVLSHTERAAIRQSGEIEQMENALGTLLEENGIRAKVYGRTKHLFSIYRKMVRKTIDFDDLYDIFAYRIIVENIEECYRVLGLVHTRYRPIKGQFEDYIATPKPNGYQSLHTVVIGNFGERAEIQIRTAAMHDIAENGVAAHWRYKETGKSESGKKGKKTGETEEFQQIQWLRQIVEVQQDLDANAPSSMLDELKYDVFSDYVFVFSPKGDVQELPRDASPIDFAFSIHTEIGLRCTGAKVNGRIVPLKHKLKNGDVVEIITSKNQHPKKEWLECVKTSRAKTKIRHKIREEERERSKEIGYELAEKEMKAYGLNLNKLVKAGEIEKHFEHFKVRSIDELLIGIGRGRFGALELVKTIAPEKVEETEEFSPISPPRKRKRRKKAKSGIRVSGLDDILIHFAQCCKPIQGDEVVGFVTRGRGVTIHRANCKKIANTEQERLVDTYWDIEEEYEMPVRLKVTSNDRAGLLNALSAVFTSKGINIASVFAKSRGEGQKTDSYFLVHLKNLDEMKMIQKELRQVKGVLNVKRVGEIPKT